MCMACKDAPGLDQSQGHRRYQGSCYFCRSVCPAQRCSAALRQPQLHVAAVPLQAQDPPRSWRYAAWRGHLLQA